MRKTCQRAETLIFLRFFNLCTALSLSFLAKCLFRKNSTKAFELFVFEQKVYGLGASPLPLSRRGIRNFQLRTSLRLSVFF